ncbi:hypothetical protein [Candidatus Cyanaurora vandensis]|uniref:hypothetical protein n=1 Tax=Candidatus Cyanaurora vandensis TaxID=2714958 RepID=UPI00257FEAF6|nr:hypothetical protein [Candidatus Cyanaurora vandensis]
MIDTLLLHIEPCYIVRAEVNGGYSAHGTGACVEEAEDNAVARAMAFAGLVRPADEDPRPSTPVPVAPPQPQSRPSAPVAPTPRQVSTTGTNPPWPGAEAMAEGKRIAELKAQTDADLKILGWSGADGKKHLFASYKKNLRGELTLPEYEEFAAFLGELVSHTQEG